ncbi:hypothetical protein [Schleiferilactobacillus harbinensis]|uniref:hypothetical protein n=1 Tax=Schleiferilactobacillus harbinensis TaxID=304207 RepID=UPI0039BED7AE
MTTKNQQIGNKEPSETSKENNELITTLRREVEDLKSQRDKHLATKDQQINDLTKLLNQSQQLQLMTENKLKLLESPKPNSSQAESPADPTPHKPDKKHWWQRW